MTILITKEEFARLLTAERRSFIKDCILGGLRDYSNPEMYPTRAKVDHTPSVQAAIRNSHIVGRAARGAPALGIRIENRSRRILFIIEDKLRISFKKLTRSLRPMNVATVQSINFLGQKLDIQPLTNVVAGYLPDLTATTFEVWITCPIDEDNYWTLKLVDAQVSEMFDSGTIPEVGQRTIKRRGPRVQVRQPAAAEDANESPA